MRRSRPLPRQIAAAKLRRQVARMLWGIRHTRMPRYQVAGGLDVPAEARWNGHEHLARTLAKQPQAPAWLYAGAFPVPLRRCVAACLPACLRSQAHHGRPRVCHRHTSMPRTRSCSHYQACITTRAVWWRVCIGPTDTLSGRRSCSGAGAALHGGVCRQRQRQPHRTRGA